MHSTCADTTTKSARRYVSPRTRPLPHISSSPNPRTSALLHISLSPFFTRPACARSARLQNY